MEITIQINGQALPLEVSIEVYTYLDQANHKDENLAHEQRRHWDMRELDEYIDKALFPLTSSFSKLSKQTENLKRSQQATKERKKSQQTCPKRTLLQKNWWSYLLKRYWFILTSRLKLCLKPMIL